MSNIKALRKDLRIEAVVTWFFLLLDPQLPEPFDLFLKLRPHFFQIFGYLCTGVEGSRVDYFFEKGMFLTKR